MSTISHRPSTTVPDRRRLLSYVLVPEMWASLTIAVIWLAVLFDAVWGPDIVNETPGGTNSRVPSAVVVAFFAFLASWVVAKYGFARRREDDD
jgi:hypothetical protein